MRNYITQISLNDFKILFPYREMNETKSSFPQTVILISEGYPTLPNHQVTDIVLTCVEHIYSTRDYWEVKIKNENKRHKIPKRYTEAVYLIEED